jgi:pimeloyl-ACP methyl ester carboxylesterase
MHSLRRIAEIVSLVIVAIALSLRAPAAEQSFDPGPYLHAQHLVDIGGGRRLNLYCTGTSSPTVILDAGLGGTTAVWRLVQPAIARTARVCSYDRAGMGFSDPAPLPRDAATVVIDLHALLQRAAIDPPYVLVGHSIAGLYERLYADRYPKDVAGMVLVDPVYPNEIRDFETISPAEAKSLASQRTYFAKCSAAASSHQLIPGTDIYNACGLLDATQLHKQCETDGFALCRLDELQNDQQGSAAYWAATASEYEAMGGASATEVQNEQRDLGRFPLIVLTRGNTDNLELWKQMHAAHEGIAETSSIGTDIIVAHSGHDIELEHPEAVVSAIADVLGQIRRNTLR